MLRKALSMSVLVLAAIFSVQISAAPPPLIPELNPYASFSYLCMDKDTHDFVDDIWLNNESKLVRIQFKSIDYTTMKLLNGMKAIVHDKKNSICEYTTEDYDVPPMINSNPANKHWWGITGFIGITTNEIILIFDDSLNSNMLLVSYTMKKGKNKNELVKNNTIVIPTVNASGVTTKLRSAWTYNSKVYYVVSSTDNGTGAVTDSDIFVYDSKLSTLLKQMANPNTGNLIYGRRGETSMSPLPPGYVADDYNVTEADGSIKRYVNIYKQP